MKGQREIARLIHEWPSGRYFVLKYEDLVKHPERCLVNLQVFLHVPPEPVHLVRKIATDFGNYYRRPWMEKSQQSIDMNCADNWRNRLSDGEIALMEMLMEKELRLFGYPLLTDQEVPKSVWLRQGIKQVGRWFWRFRQRYF